MRFTSRLVLAAGLMMGVAAVVRADNAPNPQYASGSKFKVGASSTVTMTMNMGGQAAVQTITTKLKDLTPEKATIERSTTMTVMGRDMAMPATTQEIPAKGEMTAGPRHAGPPDMLQPVDTTTAKDMKTGNEDIKVGDKTIATTWSEFTVILSAAKDPLPA